MHQAMTTDISKGTNALPTWWSPELRNAKLTVVYWELRRVQRITGMSMDIAINGILEQLPSENPLQATPNDFQIEAMIRRRKSHVRDVVRHSFETRQQFLLQLITDYNVNGDNTVARKIQNLKNNEMTKMSYRKIKRYLKPMENTKLTYVDVACGASTTRVTKGMEVENALLAHHKKHFSQAEHTPFARPDVIQRFVLAADTD